MTQEELNNLEEVLKNPKTQEDTKEAIRQMLKGTMDRQFALASRIQEILKN